jgi:hypothetical protein
MASAAAHPTRLIEVDLFLVILLGFPFGRKHGVDGIADAVCDLQIGLSVFCFAQSVGIIANFR